MLYDYNEEDVYRKAGLSENRVNVVYAKVSTPKQKRDLENQEETLINYCNANGANCVTYAKNRIDFNNLNSFYNMDALDSEGLLPPKVADRHTPLADCLAQINCVHLVEKNNLVVR